MSADYEFELPLGPSVNGLRFVARGRLVTSAKGREYYKEIQRVINVLGLHGKNIERPVTIHLTICQRTRAKFDVSNYLKAFEDAIVKAGFLEDDHWIEYNGIKKGPVVKGGLLKVKVFLGG